MPDAPPSITRLAPSPTGALHLGNARTFLVNAALAHKHRWRTVLRVEDLDTPRVKPGAIQETVDLLRWLGLTWDLPAPHEPVVPQSLATHRHARAMDALCRAGLVYPCTLTRTEIEAAASAPHLGDHESRFPPELRPEKPWPARFPTAPSDDPDLWNTNWRFATPPGQVPFTDRFAGAQITDPAHEVGDFVVWTKRGQASYQLAVVVDDADAQITHIVRGDDLIPSTGRQLLLHRALFDVSRPEPAYFHAPLIVGPDGRRLAKRHGDSRLTHYRTVGVPVERVIGLCAAWSGVTPRTERRPMPTTEFIRAFDPGTMPRQPAVLTTEDETWLLHGG